jgi:hypothetical protein
MKKLTIGMATYDDYDGVFFSIQALRMYHPICTDEHVEFIVVDGNPDGPHGKECKKFVEGAVRGKYIPYKGTPSSFNKYKIADHASGEYVLIIDCHVLIQSGGIDYLLQYFDANYPCKNLVQGPLIYDNMKNISTHFDTVWRGDMYGIWATDNEKYALGQPFEIPMQGMGLLAFKKSEWHGISKHFKGFGAEEGYIAEKFRSWGGKNVCLPQLGWNHRFGRPNGVKYRLFLEDRIWNYFIGWLEITQDPNHKMINDIKEHFKDRIPQEKLNNIFEQAKNLIFKERKDAATQ